MIRKKLLHLLVMSVLLLLVAACAAPAAAPAARTGTTEETVAEDSGAPTQGGSIVVAIGSEPDMLWPQRGSSSWASLVNMSLYDTLIYMAPDGSLQPGNGMVLQINHDKFPGDMKEVRLAMNYALDQVGLNNTLYSGRFDPAAGPISPSTPCYWEGVEEFYPYDIEMARQILTDAGFEDTDGDGIVELDGQPLALDFYWNAEIAGWTELAEAVQAQLQQAGFQENLYGQARTAYFAAVHDGIQGMNFMWFPREDPDILRLLFHSNQAIEGGFNRSYYRNTEVDEYLDSAATLSDVGERCELYALAQERIMDDAAIAPVNNRISFWGAHSYVQGLVIPQIFPLYNDVYLTE